MIERAAHVRSVATAKGRRVRRPIMVDAAKLEYAAHLRDAGHTIAEIVTKTGVPRSSLKLHLPPRAPEPVDACTRRGFSLGRRRKARKHRAQRHH